MNRKARPWTADEENHLRQFSISGEDVLKASIDLDRTLGSVIAKMFALGLKVPPVKRTDA